MGFDSKRDFAPPSILLVAQLVKCLPAMQETWVRSLGWEDPWRRKWKPTPVSLPGESHGRRSLIGYSPQGRKEVGHNWVTSLSLHHLAGTSPLPLDTSSSKLLQCHAATAPYDPLVIFFYSTPVSLPGESHGQRKLAGYSPWVARVRHDLATKTWPTWWLSVRQSIPRKVDKKCEPLVILLSSK